ncbi:hypothetical protein H310_14543 [Aphanomyces invadans]|uniref:Uncharacterized protein n=1 Tax=Aphanomyces invadans TaxID=157072 RepID=A0A024T9I0_9STRA|nr:hypothetical protein H310_14543 [Aphanomyces invadans]ETV90703.1 hypothetical protein H310_14543 [Aphanomyces invadans]|eukprot:XP_008880643.1 hypothetical protein H310_14543 [Aphanomyces invadans]
MDVAERECRVHYGLMSRNDLQFDFHASHNEVSTAHFFRPPKRAYEEQVALAVLHDAPVVIAAEYLQAAIKRAIAAWEAMPTSLISG